MVGTLAVALGAAVWLASPLVTGRHEPWDAHSPYYVVALTGAGLLTGWLEPRRFWRWSAAIYAGQCLAVFAQVLLWGADLGLFIPLGMIVLAIFTGLSLIGGLIGSALRGRPR